MATVCGRWASLALLIAGCSAPVDGEPEGPCPNGICGQGANGAGSGAQASGSGAGSSAAGGCVPAWTCTPWETDGVSSDASRSCVDANACGDDSDRPVEAVTLPALSEPFYRCNVEPVLDRKCAHLACHGVEPSPPPGRALRVYARGRLRHAGESWPSMCNHTTSEDCSGTIECSCRSAPHSPTEWRRNYDSARGFALAPDGAPLASIDASDLLAQPLIGGGLAHAGMKMWREGDADYQTVRDWLLGAQLASCTTGN